MTLSIRYAGSQSGAWSERENENLVTYGDYTDSPATKDSLTVVFAGRRPGKS